VAGGWWLGCARALPSSPHGTCSRSTSPRSTSPTRQAPSPARLLPAACRTVAAVAGHPLFIQTVQASIRHMALSYVRNAKSHNFEAESQ